MSESELALLWRLIALVAGVAGRLRPAAHWDFRRGLARERLGDVSGARTAYEAALAAPDRPAGWSRRLLAILDRQGDLDAAVAVHAEEARRGHDPAGHHRAAARLLGRLGRWDEAIEHVAAAGGLPDPAEGLIAFQPPREAVAARQRFEQLLAEHPAAAQLLDHVGEQRATEGDHAGAAAAYELALDVAGLAAPPILRVRAARVEFTRGRWKAACDHLLVNLERHPWHPPTLRQLARVAAEVDRFGGWFEHDPKGAGRFVPVEGSLEGHRAVLGSLTDHAQVASWALERAALATDAGPVWLGQLPELRAAAGYHAGAVASLEEAIRRARQAGDQASLRTVHGLEFRLERLHHDAGVPRVDDPLFACSASAVDPADAPADAPGSYSFDFDHLGAVLRGVAVSRDVGPLVVRLDGQPLRTVRLSANGTLPRFAFRLRRGALARLPRKSRLTVETADGDRLLAGGRGRVLEVVIPHGDGSVETSLARGEVVDKKGSLPPEPSELARRQDAYLALYERARSTFAEVLDRELFVMFGTLLGVHRGGDLIPGDDDFDAGFVATACGPEAVKAETVEIIVELLRAGFTVACNRRGRLFRLGHPDLPREVHLDLVPLWFEDGEVWVHNDVCFPAVVEDFLPTTSREVRGTQVLVPRRPEAFLAAQYGPTWATPDPGYATYPADVPERVRGHLARGLMTPAECRQLAARLGADPRVQASGGRFVSMAEQPLYPLDEFLD